jgi:hypothetical protein
MFTLYITYSIGAIIFFLCTGNPLAAVLWPINLIVNLIALVAFLIVLAAEQARTLLAAR